MASITGGSLICPTTLQGSKESIGGPLRGIASNHSPLHRLDSYLPIPICQLSTYSLPTPPSHQLRQPSTALHCRHRHDQAACIGDCPPTPPRWQLPPAVTQHS